MKFKLEIKMDNAAFEDPAELADILRRIAAKFAMAGEWEVIPKGEPQRVMDSNGNTVGEWKVSK